MEGLAFDILQTIRESLLILDGELRVQIANDAFYRTFATSREKIEGRLLPELGNGDWNILSLQSALQLVLQSDVPLESFVVRHHFSGLGERTISLNARPIRRETGQIPLLLLAIEDISERQIIEDVRLLHLEKLEQSNRELQDFAFIAAHDLQEPLRAIQSFSERLRTRSAALLDEQSLDYLQRIEKAATRMRQLVSGLLAYSRLTANNHPRGEVDLNEMMPLVLADLAAGLEEIGGRVEIGELPVICGDATQIRQLFQNLISNGLKFHRKGEAPCIEISGAGIENGFHVLRVSDNGIGFEEQHSERIFSPFERLNSQRDTAGTGIGLAICRKIVERQGGRIQAQSEVGKGTTFRIWWPLQTANSMSKDKAP